jgi:hypothetical protein
VRRMIPSDYRDGVYETAEYVMSFINSLDESEPQKIRSRIYQCLMEVSPLELYKKKAGVNPPASTPF